ncbi:MAG: LysR family transcriptional regulator [Proteobacteria bacterium]|jgi:DNA-binding transcriptional LysR family regulator|nr:LysR family transcriptional regulator [Ramlibacter sp.]MCA0214853.1 LysR family transcriptional regulator [Pseudomonadota bacterium]
MPPPKTPPVHDTAPEQLPQFAATGGRVLPSMQFSVLKYFLAVARTGSIRLASEELFVAPSAVSRQMTALEEDLGIPLFERSAKGVRLTAAGEVFASTARSIFRKMERARSEIDDLRGLKRGHVTIYAVEGVVAEFLFPLLATFNQKFPNISFEIQVTGTDDVLRALIEDRGDIGLAFNPEADREILEIRQSAHPVVAVTLPGHEVAQVASLPVSALASQVLGLPDRSFGVRRLLDDALLREHVQHQPFLQVNSIEMAKAFVRAGMGLTVLPEFAVHTEKLRGEFASIQLHDRQGPLSATLVLCTHRDRHLSAAARRVLSMLNDAMPATGGAP